MVPFIMGAISAAAPAVIDLLTGASKKKRQALDAQQAQLQGVLDRINGEMGTGANDSLSYKTTMTAADKTYKKQSNANAQAAAASGMSDEAQLGQLATMNDGYGTLQLGALSKADQDRKALQTQYDQVAAQKAGLGVARAQDAQTRQDQLINGAMQLMPHLLDAGNMFTSAETKDVATGATAAPTLNQVDITKFPSTAARPQLPDTWDDSPARLNDLVRDGSMQINPNLGTNGYFSPSTFGTSRLADTLSKVKTPSLASIPGAQRSTQPPLFPTNTQAAPMAFKNQQKGFYF